jgi:rubrerythrin
MKLGQAIAMALQYEKGVHKAYADAAKKASNPSAKRIFEVLADEEMGHIKYLEQRLQEWEDTGKIKHKKLGTSIPAQEVIHRSLQELRKTVVRRKSTRLDPEIELLKKAWRAEVKTSNFYKDMVKKLDGDGQKLFRRFVEIEEGHDAIVQAQIDSASGLGVFLDSLEFGLEVG